MIFKILNLICFTFLLFSSCELQEEKVNKRPLINNIMDSHTLSNYKEITITNSHLNLSVDFEKKILTGSVKHDFIRNQDTDLLILDSKYLIIDSICDELNNDLDYNLEILMNYLVHQLK